MNGKAPATAERVLSAVLDAAERLAERILGDVLD